jgi:hypothetical protein
MYSVRREELPSGKAREQPWRRTATEGGPVVVADRPVREGKQKEEMPCAGSSLRQSHQPVWTTSGFRADGVTQSPTPVSTTGAYAAPCQRLSTRHPRESHQCTCRDYFISYANLA